METRALLLLLLLLVAGFAGGGCAGDDDASASPEAAAATRDRAPTGDSASAEGAGGREVPAAGSAGGAAAPIDGSLAGGARSAAKVALVLRLVEGTSFVVRSETDQVIRQTIGDAALEVRQLLDFHTRHRIESVDERGGAVIDVTFLRVRVDERGGANALSYDSDSAPAGEPPPTPFAALVGRSYTKFVASDGTIRRIEGASRLIEEMLDVLLDESGAVASRAGAATGTGTSDAAGPATTASRLVPAAYRELLRTQFDEDALRDLEQASTPIFPAHPVGAGDSWENRVVVRRVAPMTLTNTYRVVRLAAGELVVDLTSIVEPNPDPAIAETNALPDEPTATIATRVRLSGRQKGSLWIDDETGLVLAATIHQELIGTRSVAVVGNAEPREDPISIRGTTRIVVDRGRAGDE